MSNSDIIRRSRLARLEKAPPPAADPKLYADPPAPSMAWALLVSARPKQWVKNLACLAGLIFSGRLFLPEMQLSAALAVLAFSLLSSACYLFNDILDRERDRTNPRTAGRPIALGIVPVWLAGFTAACLAFTGGWFAYRLAPECLAVLGVYAVLNVAYSVRLKRTVIVDVMCIAFGFVLRVLFGVFAVHVLPTPWILLCMFCLALLLGFGKRRAELSRLGQLAIESRYVLHKYSPGYLDLLIGVTTTLTILTYLLYTATQKNHPILLLSVLPVSYCVLRYVHQVVVEGRGESPEELILRDKMLWLGVVSWVVLCVLALYGNWHFNPSWTLEL